MLRFEKRIPCVDEGGGHYLVEVYVDVRIVEDGAEVLGQREAYLAGTAMGVRLDCLEDDEVFGIPGGGWTLRRVGDD